MHGYLLPALFVGDVIEKRHGAIFRMRAVQRSEELVPRQSQVLGEFHRRRDAREMLSQFRMTVFRYQMLMVCAPSPPSFRHHRVDFFEFLKDTRRKSRIDEIGGEFAEDTMIASWSAQEVRREVRKSTHRTQGRTS